jgi:hypothetical protein
VRPTQNIFVYIVIVMHHQGGIWIKCGITQEIQNVSFILIYYIITSIQIIFN